MGIEPTTSAWKAEVLPLNYTRVHNAFLIDLPIFIGRSGRIRTCDPLLPRQVLYQTEPRPEYEEYYNCLLIKSQVKISTHNKFYQTAELFFFINCNNITFFCLSKLNSCNIVQNQSLFKIDADSLKVLLFVQFFRQYFHCKG